MDARHNQTAHEKTDPHAAPPGPAWVEGSLVRASIVIGILFNVAIIGYTIMPMMQSLLRL